MWRGARGVAYLALSFRHQLVDVGQPVRAPPQVGLLDLEQLLQQLKRVLVLSRLDTAITHDLT